jgi:hypothetical protein
MRDECRRRLNTCGRISYVDKTIDLNEAKAAADVLFGKLDVDKDGTLDLKELHGRLTEKQFREADPDNDNTLTKNEYLAFVEQAFKAADPDGDGTLDGIELNTEAGQALLHLLK